MNYLFFLTFLNFFFYGKSLIYECPNNHKLMNNQQQHTHDSRGKSTLKCDFVMTNPKKVINPYRDEIRNYVQSKPFGSICLKCSMCLAIAKEMDKIFEEISDSNKSSKQSEVVVLLNENIKYLCSHGFENHDLRKFKQYQVVSDEFKCSTHVRSKMDGKWTEKLREMCATYSNYMDVQYLLNEYLKGIGGISNYLCRNDGIFRDCSSLNFQNTSINPEQKDVALTTCD